MLVLVERNGKLVVVVAWGTKAATLVVECHRNSHGSNTFQEPLTNIVFVKLCQHRDDLLSLTIILTVIQYSDLMMSDSQKKL